MGIGSVIPEKRHCWSPLGQELSSGHHWCVPTWKLSAMSTVVWDEGILFLSAVISMCLFMWCLNTTLGCEGTESRNNSWSWAGARGCGDHQTVCSAPAGAKGSSTGSQSWGQEFTWDPDILTLCSSCHYKHHRIWKMETGVNGDAGEAHLLFIPQAVPVPCSLPWLPWQRVSRALHWRPSTGGREMEDCESAVSKRQQCSYGNWWEFMQNYTPTVLLYKITLPQKPLMLTHDRERLSKILSNKIALELKCRGLGLYPSFVAHTCWAALG